MCLAADLLFQRFRRVVGLNGMLASVFLYVKDESGWVCIYPLFLYLWLMVAIMATERGNTLTIELDKKL